MTYNAALCRPWDVGMFSKVDPDLGSKIEAMLNRTA
jgi:hypothetical protein